MIAWVAITSFLEQLPTAVTMLPRRDIGFLRSKRVFGIRGACDEPNTLLRGQEPDGPVPSGLAWRRMLRGACTAVVTTITWRRMLPGSLSSRVVTTIAVEEDAPRSLLRGGDDDPWRRMLWEL